MSDSFHLFFISFILGTVQAKNMHFRYLFLLLQQDYHHKIVIIKKFNYFNAAY